MGNYILSKIPFPEWNTEKTIGYRDKVWKKIVLCKENKYRYTNLFNKVMKDAVEKNTVIANNRYYSCAMFIQRYHYQHEFEKVRRLNVIKGCKECEKTTSFHKPAFQELLKTCQTCDPRLNCFVCKNGKSRWKTFHGHCPHNEIVLKKPTKQRVIRWI